MKINIVPFSSALIAELWPSQICSIFPLYGRRLSNNERMLPYSV
jgi:hypothetical protein